MACGNVSCVVAAHYYSVIWQHLLRKFTFDSMCFDNKKGITLKMMLLYCFFILLQAEKAVCLYQKAQEEAFRGRRRGTGASVPLSLLIWDVPFLKLCVTSSVPPTSLLFLFPQKKTKGIISSQTSYILQEKYCKHSWLKKSRTTTKNLPPLIGW